MRHNYSKFNLSGKILIFVLLNCIIPLGAVTVAELQSSDDYLYGMAKADNYEIATELALKNLISKINVSVEAVFTKYDAESDEDYKSRVERTITTYSSTTLYNVPDLMQLEDGKTVVWRYMKKTDIDKIFAKREKKITSYYSLGKEMEEKHQISDALRNYYWALELLKTHPEEANLMAPGEDITLQAQLFNRIRVLLTGVNFALDKIQEDTEKQRQILKFKVTYNGNRVANLNYRFYTSESSWSKYNSVSEGLAYVELPLCYKDNKLTIQLQYRYEQVANIDKEVQTVLTGIGTNADYFGESQRELMLIAEREEINSSSISLDVYDQVNHENVSELAEKEIVEELLKGLRNQSKGLQKYFTTEGYSDFEKILCYGKAEVLEADLSGYMVNFANEKQIRGIPMRFCFAESNTSFIERVNFKFDEHKKIKGITFGLGDGALRDIMAKDESMWKPEEKYQLINFLEYYKTAYCLEDIDYINNVFADNALIIVGRIMEKDDFAIENMTQSISEDEVKYIRYKKDEYVEHLRQVFASNEYVNIHFEDNEIKHYSNDPDSALYGIQIKQNYYSENYGDQGYLFLMMDLNEPEKPRIYIRTWQPKKFDDGTIYGVDDFRIN